MSYSSLQWGLFLMMKQKLLNILHALSFKDILHMMSGIDLKCHFEASERCKAVLATLQYMLCRSSYTLPLHYSIGRLDLHILASNIIIYNKIFVPVQLIILHRKEGCIMHLHFYLHCINHNTSVCHFCSLKCIVNSLRLKRRN